MLKDLKTLNTDRFVELDEAVALLAEAKTYEAQYQVLQIATPEYISDATRTLTNYINGRVRDEREKLLKQIRQKKEALKTPDQKRTDLDQQEANLLALLAGK